MRTGIRRKTPRMTRTGAVKTQPASVSPRRSPLRGLRLRGDAVAVAVMGSAHDRFGVRLDRVEDLLRIARLQALERGVEVGDDRRDAVVGGDALGVVRSREEGGEVRVV